MRFLLIIFVFNQLFANKSFPADSLFTNNKINLINKIGILPIAAWQRISYNVNLFNCQFYPSCSNYGAIAIKQYGIIKGGIITSDRITRCNPFALKYHLELNLPFKYKDGRLIDPINQKFINKSKKSPFLAASMSAFIPGLGRIYAGRIWDGLIGFFSFYMIGESATLAFKKEKTASAPLLGLIATYIYLGEIYGAWRTAKFYQKEQVKSHYTK